MYPLRYQAHHCSWANSEIEYEFYSGHCPPPRKPSTDEPNDAGQKAKRFARFELVTLTTTDTSTPAK